MKDVSTNGQTNAPVVLSRIAPGGAVASEYIMVPLSVAGVATKEMDTSSPTAAVTAFVVGAVNTGTSAAARAASCAMTKLSVSMPIGMLPVAYTST